MALPQHGLDTHQRISVRSAKTLWVRFDRNDYSIPPSAVGKDLVLLAAGDQVRIFEGLQEVASHRRCYHQGEQITDPAHAAALLRTKRAARGGAASPLRLAVPEADRFLDAAFPRHRNTARLTDRLARLLALYGADLLRAAVTEALGEPHEHFDRCLPQDHHPRAGFRCLELPRPGRDIEVCPPRGDHLSRRCTGKQTTSA